MLFDKIQLESGETVVKTARKHWFILCGDVGPYLFLFFVPVLLYFVITHIDTPLGQFALPDIRLTIFAFTTWTLFLLAGFFQSLTDYYLDVWIITSSRIIAIDQRGLFRRSVASCRIERIQNVDVEIHGIIATLIDFGTLRIETAGEDHDFIIRGIGKPREAKASILEIADGRERASN
jgi:uncharacterized membrane protein YdbT with pleckstrin-like domain